MCSLKETVSLRLSINDVFQSIHSNGKILWQNSIFDTERWEAQKH